MTTLAIPLRTTGYPAISQEIELDGRLYGLALRWNEREEVWYLTLSDQAGAPIVAGVRVVVDWDLLRKCVDARRPPGTLMAVDSTGEGDPGLSDLGDRVKIVYVEAGI